MAVCVIHLKTKVSVDTWNSTDIFSFQYPKCAYGPNCKLKLIQNGVYILIEVSFYIINL